MATRLIWQELDRYSELIADADETLAQNVRVRIEAADTHARTSVLLLSYRSHRFFHIAGSSDADNRDRVRSRLRAFWMADEMPKSYVGYSHGSVCEACRTAIRPGDIEYDLVTPAIAVRLDGPCYRIFIEESTTPGPAAPAD